jgi:hypothetical protein
VSVTVFVSRIIKLFALPRCSFMFYFTTSACFLVPVQFLEETGISLACLSCSDGTVTAVRYSVTGFRSNYGLDVTNEHLCMSAHAFCVCVCARACACVRACVCM